jgi:hypothetical protein
MWNRKLLCMWKSEIEEKNHLLNVPRAAFTLRKKLKYGLKNCLDKITQIFRVAGDYSKNRDEFETTFAYMEYTMRKHINDTLGPKHEEMKQAHKRNDGPGRSKIKILIEEMEEIKKKRNYLLNLINKISELSLELKEWMFEEPTLGYRNKYYSSIAKIIELCEALEETDKQEAPFNITNSEDFSEWVNRTDIEDWRLRTEKHFQTQCLGVGSPGSGFKSQLPCTSLKGGNSYWLVSGAKGGCGDVTQALSTWVPLSTLARLSNSGKAPKPLPPLPR